MEDLVDEIGILPKSRRKARSIGQQHPHVGIAMRLRHTRQMMAQRRARQKHRASRRCAAGRTRNTRLHRRLSSRNGFAGPRPAHVDRQQRDAQRRRSGFQLFHQLGAEWSFGPLQQDADIDPTWGAASFSICSDFAAISPCIRESPVTLPPGRGRLATEA